MVLMALEALMEWLACKVLGDQMEIEVHKVIAQRDQVHMVALSTRHRAQLAFTYHEITTYKINRELGERVKNEFI